ncbi:SERINE/THREONINE-PROTEIN KINASE CDL1-LIKE ISOFORM X1 [Salix viminalis]|uniref:SERINE/THREONINE-PROTEIN KINASE CDL1-LIKE ISOFORM X1 n=2 Tax=Salix viminalis TaxID=40686 RepID=A0A9Q0NKV6_SALVM|nr:SERINE/THREONINE-PROTEIN KINASE CDL1-LIKE ISOFORM X1 [Salix viminalis]
MAGKASREWKVFPLLKSKQERKRKIVVGLKSDNYSREMLLRFLRTVINPRDDVLAIHVQESSDSFDPNTFYIHEDICKAKQVDFTVKVCNGDSYISELGYQVRVNHAAILAVGCSLSGIKQSVVNDCLKELPPTCRFLVMDKSGKIILQRQGTSQQGSVSAPLRHPLSSSSEKSYFHRQRAASHLRKSLTVPLSSTASSIQQTCITARQDIRKAVRVPDFWVDKVSHGLHILEAKGLVKHFTFQELDLATNSFCPEMVIGVGGHSKVYRANLVDGQAVAVKILKKTHSPAEDLLHEVRILSDIKHENIIQIIGFCHSKEMHALVYNLLIGSLKQNLRRLKWNERMGVAVGVAKALEHLHHSFNPPIIHRDVKSSNILLSGTCQPQLSDFGAAMVNQSSEQIPAITEPFKVAGTFGYLAPEYMMYGKVDEKVDVYSYGVVLLELITGQEAIQTSPENHESLVLRARSLLSSGLCERLIDPHLSGDYEREEMEIMISVARLCLVRSSSRRPTMKMISRLFQEPEYRLNMQRERDKLLDAIESREGKFIWRKDDSTSTSKSSLPMDDSHHEILLSGAPD